MVIIDHSVDPFSASKITQPHANQVVLTWIEYKLRL